MSIAALIREALLTRSVPATLPPPVALQHRLYQAVISIVLPTATTLRAIGVQRIESDEALLAAFASGDAGAFETLMQRHLGWMVAWACKHLPGPDAEDAAQEAFIALVRKAAGLHLDSALRGYLFGSSASKYCARGGPCSADAARHSMMTRPAPRFLPSRRPR